MPGVVAVLTGADLAADKIGNLICGWAISSKDGTPMKMSAHPAIANEKANHVGDAVAVVVAETLAQAKDAGEKLVIDYEVLPAVADPAKAQAAGAPLIHEVRRTTRSTSGISATRRRSRPRSRRQPRHQARLHQQPPGRTRSSRAPRSATTMPGRTR
jgi:CO/xanthine dehydrogenase Mo-binding subunit